jgi:hypothetical protein
MIAFFASATPGRFSRPSSSLNLLAALPAGSYGYTAAGPYVGARFEVDCLQSQIPLFHNCYEPHLPPLNQFLACVSSQFLVLLDNKVIIKHNLR